MKTLTFSLFLYTSLALSLQGQASNFAPCSLPADWSSISLSTNELPDASEKILVVTCRPMEPDAPDGVIFPNAIADYRKVTCLVAACESGAWQLYPVDHLTSGLKMIDDGRDILLFVHGHGKSMPLVLTRANQIRELYGVSLVVFDWPSYNSNFNKSLTRVRLCGENFYNLLLQLSQYRQQEMETDQHLSLLMHSLGNYYLTHLVVNGNNQYMKEKIFDNIIMNAAAVRSKEHGEVISQVRIQDQLYVVYNNRDKVLRGAHLLTSGKMLGNQAMEPLADNATYVDFSMVAGTQHTYFAGYHQFEYDLPAFNHFYHDAFHGREADFSNASMFLPGAGEKVHLVMNPLVH
ncbi:MAG: alpha/beta hydrolase [Bacteroidota bacterium]